MPGSPGEISAYFGISIDAAVNLREAREYSDMDRLGRLRIALAEQQQFLGGLLGYRGRAAFDLRIDVSPEQSAPIRMAVLGRTWAATEQQATSQAADIRRQLKASAPRHIVTSPIDSPDTLTARLDPYPGVALQSALITRREIVGVPSRPDAGCSFYFSVAPFNRAESDWTPLYATLAASRVPMTLSIALFPVGVPAQLERTLAMMTTFYGRLAREDEVAGGLYYGPRKLPPDAFAVEAERVFAQYLRRWTHAAFLMRVQISAPRLPTGIVETLASVISPPEQSDGSNLDRDRSGATHEVRWVPPDLQERAGWSLAAIDCFHVPGRAEVWARNDAPPTELSLLASLGDAYDAACAFRFPVAFNGSVPGFPVRKGHFGQEETNAHVGPTITIGRGVDGRSDLQLPLAALTKHALVSGSPGSGKSTTVVEILAQLWGQHSVPFLVVEPVNSDANDYRKLVHLPGFESMRVLTVGDENGAPLRFNPFEVPRGVLVAEHIANLLACFKAAFGLWEPLPSIYQHALDMTYLKAGILSSEVATDDIGGWPTTVEFVKAMTLATSDLGYAGDVKANIEAASIRRAQNLVAGATASTFLTDQPLEIEGLLAVPTILELKSLGSGDEQALMMALLLNAMTEHYKANRGSVAQLAHVTVIEEAHRLLEHPKGSADSTQAQARERAASEFANALAENRKYGEGVIIAEQVPTKLVEDAIKNTNLKIMHRLTSDEERQILGRSMGLDESQNLYATRLRTGEALVYSDEYADTRHVEVRRSITVAPGPLLPMATPPFKACSPCRAKCQYRGASMAVLRDETVRKRLSEVRRDVARKEEDSSVVRTRWTVLLSALRQTVDSFRALPSEEPGVSDAAFCLFLHSLGGDTMAYSEKWPASVAQKLGISVREESDV